MKRSHIANSEKGARKGAVEALRQSGYNPRLADVGGVCRTVYFCGVDEATLEVATVSPGKWRARIKIKEGPKGLRRIKPRWQRRR